MCLARRVSAVLACAALACVSAPAFAIEETPVHVGGGLGVASFARSDTGWAPAVGLHAAYELSDMFDVRFDLSASRHELVAGTTTNFYGAALGLSYKVDVGEWSPYVGLLGGYYAFSNAAVLPPLAQREWGIAVPLGLEWLAWPSVAFALQVSGHGFLSDPMDSVFDAPYVTALLRAEYRFGW